MDLTHLVAAIVFGLIVNEIIGQSDRLAKLILEKAIKRLAKNHIEYYTEAWSSHLHDCPGPLSKLRHACGCWFIAGTWRMEMTPREYISVKLLGCVGRMTEWHAGVVLGKAWLIESTATLLPKHLPISRRMNDAAIKLKTVAVIQQQASRCFKMYDYVLTSPREVDAGPLRDWLSSMGLCGGLAMYKACADHYSDYCGIRRCFGIEVRSPRLRYDPKTLEMCKIGERVIKLSLDVLEFVEKLKAQNAR